ncbi:MAG: potassium channel family protein [Patescibacteria group bacterium]
MNYNAALKRYRVKIIIATLFTLLLGGTMLFKLIEPFTWIQAFYFSVATMTTVGYGDLVPSSDTTRLVTAMYALISITLYISLATHLGEQYLERREQQVSSNEGSDSTTE